MGRTRCASGRVRLVSSCGIHMNQIQGGSERASTARCSSSPTTPAPHVCVVVCVCVCVCVRV
jgi:hypothetical protein